MPSTASSTYQDFIEGKLIAAIGTGTTTGVTVKIKQVNGATPTWPTAAHRIKIVQKTATNNKVEKFGVASGTTQSGQTVTLGTLTRALSLSDGTTFSGSAGTAQSFAAGADVFISWDNHDAAQTAKLDLANTFTDNQTIATTKKLILGDSGNYIVGVSGADLTFKDANTSSQTLSALAAAAGTDHKVLVTANDTTAGYLLGKLAAGDGITLTETNDGSDEDVTVAAVNTVATGHTGLSTVTSGGLLIGAGTSNMTIIGPGSASQVPVSNGSTIAMGTVPAMCRCVYASGTSSATQTNPTAITAFDTHTYTIPANDLVAGVVYTFDAAFTYAMGTTGTITFGVMLGSTKIAQAGVTSAASGGSTGVLRGYIVGTTSAGGGQSVRGMIAVDLGEGNGVTRAAYEAANAATNGTLALQIGAFFGTSNGGNNTVLTMAKFSKESATAFQ